MFSLYASIGNEYQNQNVSEILEYLRYLKMNFIISLQN